MACFGWIARSWPPNRVGRRHVLFLNYAVRALFTGICELLRTGIRYALAAVQGEKRAGRRFHGGSRGITSICVCFYATAEPGRVANRRNSSIAMVIDSLKLLQRGAVRWVTRAKSRNESWLTPYFKTSYRAYRRDRKIGKTPNRPRWRSHAARKRTPCGSMSSTRAISGDEESPQRIDRGALLGLKRQLHCQVA